MEQRAPRRTDTSEALESRLAGYLRSVWPGTLSDEARANLLALYRSIAGLTGGRLPAVPHPEIPEAWIERCRSGELVGVGGLSRATTPHELGLGRRTLYAWCAFDCMFLPELLGAPLEIRSPCAASGREISLRVSAHGVERAFPEDTVISFVTPEAAAVEHALRQVFCRQVRFFNSAAAASADLPPGATVLTPRLAHRLGAIRNRIVFGDTLSAPDP